MAPQYILGTLTKHNRRTLRARLIAAVCLVLLGGRTGISSPVIDQQHVVMSAVGDTPSSTQEIGQTFTVGIPGLLSFIEVQLARLPATSDSAVLTVYNTVNHVPTTSLGSAMVSSDVISEDPDFVFFNLLPLGISANVGDVLAFGVKSSAEGIYLMPFTTDNGYPPGRGVRRTLSDPPGPWTGYTPPRDYGFRTYVGEPLALAGDFNGDGQVNAADYVVWRKTLGVATEAPIRFNGNGTGGVDQGDYNVWRSNFGSSTGAAAHDATLQSAVPEPATAVHILLAISFAANTLGYRRRAV